MDRSPFDLLPRELRDQIWMHILSHGGLVHRNNTWTLRSQSSIRSALSIREVCKQMRDEIEGLFLAANPTIEFRHKLFKLECHGPASSSIRVYQRHWVDAIKRIPRSLCTSSRQIQLCLEFVDLQLKTCASPSPHQAPMFAIGQDIVRAFRHLGTRGLSLDITLCYHLPGVLTMNAYRRPVRYEALTCAFPLESYSTAVASLDHAFREKEWTIELLYDANYDADRSQKTTSQQYLAGAKHLMEDIIDGVFLPNEKAQDMQQHLQDLKLEI